jgi:hypothetical protein
VVVVWGKVASNLPDSCEGNERACQKGNMLLVAFYWRCRFAFSSATEGKSRTLSRLALPVLLPALSEQLDAPSPFHPSWSFNALCPVIMAPVNDDPNEITPLMPVMGGLRCTGKQSHSTSRHVMRGAVPFGLIRITQAGAQSYSLDSSHSCSFETKGFHVDGR